LPYLHPFDRPLPHWQLATGGFEPACNNDSRAAVRALSAIAPNLISCNGLRSEIWSGDSGIGFVISRGHGWLCATGAFV
jgi:hypothetical protein